MVVSGLKHAVTTGPAIQLDITQRMQRGLKGIMHTAAHAGQTAKAAPDLQLE